MTNLDCPVGHIQALEDSRITVSRHLVHIAAVCHVRAEWLVYEDGPMLPDGVESEMDELRRDFSEEEENLLDTWQRLPVGARAHLLALARQLARPMDPGYRALEERFEGG